jgi:hypothetical protein
MKRKAATLSNTKKKLKPTAFDKTTIPVNKIGKLIPVTPSKRLPVQDDPNP